ncbi:MAG: RICIN domain-containing protein, partial [Perlabentimonas sp.]
TASGSMVDTWKNPIGISNLLKKDVMSFTNTAVSLGWIPGAPSPTTIGFALEQGKIFHLDFGIMMALSPADGEIALWGFRDRMTMNDFTTILRDGFGLKVPDVFPKDIYIEDANILFSPNGGEVGEFEIEPGFAMKGRAKFLGAVDGSLNFYANMDDGFFVDFKLDAAFKDALMKEIRKVKPLAPIMEQVLSTLEVHRVRLYLEAGSDLNLEGQTNVHVSVLNKPIKFDFKGSFNPQTLAQEIVKRIVDATGGEAAAAVKKIASEAANASIRTAQAGYDKLGYYAKHATTWKDHATHGSRVPITGKLIHPSCYDKCVPDRARKLSTPVYESSNKAVKDFYDKVYPKVAEVAGKSLREKYIKDDWNRLTSSIDNNWERIIRDDHYKGYDKDQKDVEKLGRRYRELVRAKKQEHVNYRNKLWNKLMTEYRVPDYIMNMPSTIVPTGRKFYIQSAMNFGKNKGGYWDVPGYPNEIQKGSNIQVYNLDEGHDRTFSFHKSKERGYYEIQIGNTSNSRIDIQGGKNDNGTSVKTWEKHQGKNQRFRFYHLGNGRFKIFDRNSGKVICLSGRKNQNGTNVHIWDDHNGPWMEWYLIDVETNKPFIPFEIPEESVFYIQSAMNFGKDNNGYWDVPGYPEVINKGSNIQIFTLDEGHDRTFKPIKSVDMDYYEIQIGNTTSARVDIDYGRATNGTNVKVWERNGAKAQRFTFFHLGNGRFKIYDRNGMVICLAGRKNENRTNVHIWEDHNGAWMEWYLINTKTKKPFVPDK